MSPAPPRRSGPPLEYLREPGLASLLAGRQSRSWASAGPGKSGPAAALCSTCLPPQEPHRLDAVHGDAQPWLRGSASFSASTIRRTSPGLSSTSRISIGVCPGADRGWTSPAPRCPVSLGVPDKPPSGPAVELRAYKKVAVPVLSCRHLILRNRKTKCRAIPGSDSTHIRPL